MGLKDLLPASLYVPVKAAAAVPASGPMQPSAAVAFSPAEADTKPKIKMHSAAYYQACAIGGWMSCGLTHMAVTPLDNVKCNMQIDPAKYKSIGSGFSLVWKEAGVAGLFKGWSPTLIGYGFQGMCKFGFYEYFKKCEPTSARALEMNCERTLRVTSPRCCVQAVRRHGGRRGGGQVSDTDLPRCVCIRRSHCRRGVVPVGSGQGACADCSATHLACKAWQCARVQHASAIIY